MLESLPSLDDSSNFESQRESARKFYMVHPSVDIDSTQSSG